MKQFHIQMEYLEPMSANALYSGETVDEAKAGFLEYCTQRGMKEVQIASIRELTDEEAEDIKASFAASQASNETPQTLN